MAQTGDDFDRRFKELGGRYTGDLIKSPYFTWALGTLRNLIVQVRRVKVALPDVNIDLIDNFGVNAYASKEGGKYFIGINTGTLLLIHDIFFRMMSSRNVLPEVGDATRELDTRKMEYVEVTPLRDLAGLKKSLETGYPIDRTRTLLAQLFVQMVFEFLLWHEFGHIIFGHVDYLQFSWGDCKIKEVDDNNDDDIAADPLTLQTIEMDPDSNASVEGINALYRIITNVTPIAPELKPLFADWVSALRMWSFSIYTFFRIFAKSNNELEMGESSHPPPAVRSHFILATISTIFRGRVDATELANIENACVQAAQSVERAFEEISEQEFDLSHLIFAIQGAPYEHAMFLMRNWNKVRPLIEPFAFAPLAPLNNDDI